MERVFKYATTLKPGLKILDIPAGSGLLSEKLRALGHDVVCGDIYMKDKHYVYIDMEKRLPFEDETFDMVICLEGIEHVLEPAMLAAELARVCKKGGEIVISTPNVLSCFSRLYFLFTGFHYMFAPHDIRPVASGADRGHISPASYSQLCYWFGLHDCEPLHIMGDKWKRSFLLPLYLILVILGYPFASALIKKLNKPDAYKNGLREHLYSPALLFSRSLILVLRKAIT